MSKDTTARSNKDQLGEVDYEEMQDQLGEQIVKKCRIM